MSYDPALSVHDESGWLRHWFAIANTSQDSIVPITGASNASAQSGSCTLTWFGGTTAAPTVPPAPSDTGTIAAGTVWVNTLQTLAPNFQGYMFAVCNFQYAHGFAFISDVGARNLAMGYLALVIPDPGTGSRSGRCRRGMQRRHADAQHRWRAGQSLNRS